MLHTVQLGFQKEIKAVYDTTFLFYDSTKTIHTEQKLHFKF